MTTLESGLDLGKYKLGWSDTVDYLIKPKKGLSEEVVKEISWSCPPHVAGLVAGHSTIWGATGVCWHLSVSPVRVRRGFMAAFGAVWSRQIPSGLERCTPPRLPR